MTEMRWSSRFLSPNAGRPGTTGRAACSSRATPRTCTPRLGGQGMNTGIGDAMNLGWKLVAAVAWFGAAVAARQLRDRAPSRRRPGAADDRRVQPGGAREFEGAAVVAGASSSEPLTRVPRTRRTRCANCSAASASPMSAGAATIEWSVADARHRLQRDAPVRTVAGRRSSCWSRPALSRSTGPASSTSSEEHPELPDAVLVRPDSYVAWASERDADCRRTSCGRGPLVPGGIAAASRTGSAMRGR